MELPWAGGKQEVYLCTNRLRRYKGFVSVLCLHIESPLVIGLLGFTTQNGFTFEVLKVFLLHQQNLCVDCVVVLYFVVCDFITTT